MPRVQEPQNSWRTHTLEKLPVTLGDFFPLQCCVKITPLNFYNLSIQGSAMTACISASVFQNVLCPFALT